MVGRFGRALGSSAALAVAAYLLSWGTAAPLTAVRRGDASFDDLLVMLAAGLGWLVLGWLVAVLACTALAAAPGLIGRNAANAAGRIAPATARRLAAVAIGLTVAAGPAAACSPGPDGQLAAALAAGEQVDPNTLPSVGRPGEPILPSGLDTSAPPSARAPADTPITLTADAAAAPDDARQPTASSTGPPQDQQAVAPSAVLTTEPSREHPPADGEVVVHRGDSLWTIAARHLGPNATDADIAAEWPRWHAANRAVVGDDPDLILPGMVLRPPAR